MNSTYLHGEGVELSLGALVGVEQLPGELGGVVWGAKAAPAFCGFSAGVIVV